MAASRLSSSIVGSPSVHSSNKQGFFSPCLPVLRQILGPFPAFVAKGGMCRMLPNRKTTKNLDSAIFRRTFASSKGTKQVLNDIRKPQLSEQRAECNSSYFERKRFRAKLNQ